MKHPTPQYPSVRRIGATGPGIVCRPRTAAKRAAPATYSPLIRALPAPSELAGGTREAAHRPLASAAESHQAPPRHPTRPTYASTSALVIDAEPRVEASPTSRHAQPTADPQLEAPRRDVPHGRLEPTWTTGAAIAFATCLLWRVVHPAAIGPHSAGALARSIGRATSTVTSPAAATRDRSLHRASPEPPSSLRAGACGPVPPPSERALTEGTLRVTVGGHRVFIDGRFVGEGPGAFPVSPGKHDVLVGSMGEVRVIDVPRGDEAIVETTGWQPDDLSIVESPWAPYKDAWACALPATFAQGRLGGPPYVRCE